MVKVTYIKTLQLWRLWLTRQKLNVLKVRDWDAEIEAKTKANEANAVKLSQMAIDPNATAQEKRRHVTETAKLQEEIMQVNDEINQLKNESDLLKNSIISNYYTATQNGSVTKESLKRFSRKS